MSVSSTSARPAAMPQQDVAPKPKAMPPANATPRAPGAFAGLLAAAMATRPTPPRPQARPIAPPRPTVTTQHAKVEGKREREPEHEREPKHGRPPLDPTDPAMRNPALVACPVASPPLAAPTPAEAMEAPRAKMSMEELLPALVRRIAWAGDKHKGTVRLELGAGAHAGTTLLVHAEGGRVRVEVHGVEGGELDDFRRRLDARLRGHGLDVESVS